MFGGAQNKLGEHTMSDDFTIYDVDSETEQLLSKCLNWLLRFADCQLNEDTALKIQSAAEELAVRFQLPVQKIEITQDEYGEWQVSIDGADDDEETDSDSSRPSLSVIEGGKSLDRDSDDNNEK
jgi:hypothetical protein